ncbi:MAG: anti-anti-sigma factor [Acidimicrobiales bacterium]|nr:anti-anti-sigma factor [Acidimicrobiales bacterium]
MLLKQPLLRIDVRRQGEGIVLSLDGELDLATAGDLMAEGELQVASGYRRITLDCGCLKFCDSSGLRAMVQLTNLVLPDGEVSICHATRMLRRLLGLTGLDARIPVRDDETVPTPAANGGSRLAVSRPRLGGPAVARPPGPEPSVVPPTG